VPSRLQAAGATHLRPCADLEVSLFHKRDADSVRDVRYCARLSQVSSTKPQTRSAVDSKMAVLGRALVSSNPLFGDVAFIARTRGEPSQRSREGQR
jgi:hypothetical protein